MRTLLTLAAMRMAVALMLVSWSIGSRGAESGPGASPGKADVTRSPAAQSAPGPRLHYTHPRRPVGDVHPYHENGTYHLIYVYDPGDWRVGQLRSVDLLHWEEREMSHTPAPVIPRVLPNDGQTLGEPTYRVSPNCSGPWTVPVPDRLDGKQNPPARPGR